MTAGQKLCALPGCNRPPFPSSDRSTPHLACGNLHHQLLMAGRFHGENPALPHPHQHILDRNTAGLCALPSCHEPPHPEHSWCSRPHYLLWLSDFTSNLLPDQICMLFPACTRHVFVHENGLPSRFCGWRHCQKYVMLSAMQRRQQELTPQQSLPSALSLVESKHAHEPSMELLVHCLREYAGSKHSPKNVKVDHDFFNKHPWDVCTDEGQTSLLIVQCKYMSKGKRLMVTRENYHWKQQGRPVSKTNFTVKYFTYRVLKGKQSDVGKHGDACAYHMEEYTVDDVKEFSLVKLRKAVHGPGRRGKGRPVVDDKYSQAGNNDTCSQNNLLPEGDGMSPDSFSWELSTLVDCHDFDQIFSSSRDTEDY